MAQQKSMTKNYPTSSRDSERIVQLDGWPVKAARLQGDRILIHAVVIAFFFLLSRDLSMIVIIN